MNEEPSDEAAEEGDEEAEHGASAAAAIPRTKLYPTAGRDRPAPAVYPREEKKPHKYQDDKDAWKYKDAGDEYEHKQKKDLCGV